jgi:ParB family chromosome partitioning protein
MPIADVAGDTAGRAALEEVAREMTAAEDEGRIIKKLPLDQIEMHHLSRDRMVFDDEEMAALQASLAERGQQTPIEVLRLSEDRYGLISGLRRVLALGALGQGDVLALVKTPEDSQSTYQAMVEENEIRADLSFYERANIAVAATEQGVFADERDAVKTLFAHAPKARRSKILKFVTLRKTLGAALEFPTAIPEHLGVKLGQAIEADMRLAATICKALLKKTPADPATERGILEAALKGPEKASEKVPKAQEIAPGLVLETKAGRAVLSGKAVDQAFLDALCEWAAGRAQP